MLSEAPQVHDFVHHSEYGSGVITDVGNFGYHVDLADLNRTVYFYNEDSHLVHRFTTCRICHYEKILGRPCGEPCV